MDILWNVLFIDINHMSDLVDKCQILLIFFNKKIYYKEICLSVKNRISESDRLLKVWSQQNSENISDQETT